MLISLLVLIAVFLGLILYFLLQIQTWIMSIGTDVSRLKEAVELGLHKEIMQTLDQITENDLAHILQQHKTKKAKEAANMS